MTGRNEPCPCGSGKKFKKCCLLKEQKRDFKEEKQPKRKIVYEVSPDEIALYQREMMTFPVSFNFAFFAEAIHFEKMEQIILEKTPDSFTEELLELFDDTPFESQILISSLIRTTDYLHDYNYEDDIKIMKLMKNYIDIDSIKKEKRVIPYSLFKMHYKQKPLAKSQSKKLIESIKDAKEMGADGDTIQYKLYTFYSLCGFMSIEKEKINNFRFLKFIQSKNTRRVITQKMEEVSKQLSEEAGFDIKFTFLDFSLDLNGIVDEINDYKKYENKRNSYFLVNGNEYSLYKRRRRFFGLF